MRRVLQVFNQYREFGGEEAIILELTKVLGAHADIHNHFFQSRDWVGPGAPSKLRQAALSIYNPTSRATLGRLHREFQPDFWLFHNMLPVGSPSAYRAALDCGVPIVQYLHNYRPFSISGSYWLDDGLVGPTLRPRQFHEAIHGAWNHSVAQGIVMAAAMKFLVASGWLSAVKAWIGVSPAICEHLREAGVPAERLHALPPPWPFDPAVEIPSAPGAHFLFLGRLIPEKGILFLLDAWDRLRDSHGAGTPRLVVCGMGPLEAAVRERAARNAFVEFRGRVDGAEKAAVLRACTALLIPSLWWDPNPTVVGEAFDVGKPVIAARIGGLAYRIADGVTGCLYEPRNADELIAHVLALHASPARCREMGLAAREWLRSQADAEPWCRRLFEIVDRSAGT